MIRHGPACSVRSCREILGENDYRDGGFHPPYRLYFITADDIETLADGTTIPHFDTISIMVESLQQFDVKLQNKWDGMKAGFGSQDIASSLKYISTVSNDKYREIFTEIADQLPAIAADRTKQF